MTDCTVTGFGDNSGLDTPGPYHWRMVDPNSRTAAYLRYAGLHPSQVPPTNDGDVRVTSAEAEAAAASLGIVVNVPDPRPPLSPKGARDTVAMLRARGFTDLIALKPGLKAPVEMAWQRAPALDDEPAAEVLWVGGNVGMRTGPCNKMIFDSENRAATKFALALGLTPTFISANAQDDVNNPKYGGTHFSLDGPAGVDPALMRSIMHIKLPDDGPFAGGKFDLLAGDGRFVVGPGSRLDCAPGHMYAFVSGGDAVDPSKKEAPLWWFDRTVPIPQELRDIPGVEVMHGVFTPKERRPRKPYDPNGDRITQQVDARSLEEWGVIGHPDIEIVGSEYSCGGYCSVFRYRHSTNGRSGILHDGCDSYGHMVHSFSATLIDRLGGKESMSRLDFAAFLYGRQDDLSAFAAEHGISLGGEPTGLTRDDIEAALGDRGLQIRTGGGAVGGETHRPQLRAVPPIGSVRGDMHIEPVTDGASALEAAPVPPPAPVPGADDFTAEEAEDTGMAMFRQIAEIDASGFWNSLPFLRRLHLAATTNGVGAWGLLGATLPRIACTVPPNVRLVGASGRKGGANSGASLNLNTILTGPPEEGKSETIKLSQDLVRLPMHAVAITNGTGEGIVKSFCYTRKGKGKPEEETDAVEPHMVAPGDDSASAAPPVGTVGNGGSSGYETVHITDTVMLTAGEISGLIAEMKRQGTKATSVYRSAWVGEELGTTTGEVERRTYLASHTYRFGSVLGAQVDIDALGAIFEEGKLGSPQRFLFLPVTTAPAIGDPLRSIDIPPIDWYDGQAATVAISELVTGPQPIFIERPPAAHEEIEANRQARRARQHLAYSVAEVRRRAEDEDEGEDVKGHELLHQLKIAAVLAVADGLRHPTDDHWHAARVIMRVREILVQALLKVISAQRGVADRKRGRSQGRSQAEARAAERGATQDRVLNSALKILDLIDAAAGVKEQAELRQKVPEAKDKRRNAFRDGKIRPTYAKSWLTGTLKGHWDEAVATLVREFGVVVDHQGDLSRGAPMGARSTGPGVVPPATGFTPAAAVAAPASPGSGTAPRIGTVSGTAV